MGPPVVATAQYRNKIVQHKGPTTARKEVRSERSSAPKKTLKKAAGAHGFRKLGGIRRVPDRPLRRRPQLPTEVCERIIDWLWDDTRTLSKCALVCKAWTPRCRYQMQRHVFLWDRSHAQGHARRARAQPQLLQQARSVAFVGGANKGERAPIPHLGTFAMMSAAKLQLVWRLDINYAIWRPSDFHPLIFLYLPAFSSVTALRLANVTFTKVREFGRLICALPGLVRLRCANVLFTSTAPYASLAITRSAPSPRLTDLVIFSANETSSNVEANKALISHLCATGVVAALQRFEFRAWASSESKYLDAYREPLHELLEQCSRSLRNLKLSPDLHPGKDIQTDVISSTIASVFNLTNCGSLETVALECLNFEEVGYAWMRRVLESNVSKKLREVLIVMDRPRYSGDAGNNLQKTVSALRKDVCPQLNELFSNKDYKKLCHVDIVFCARPNQAIPDATQWSSLLEAGMRKLLERGVLRTRVDVYLRLFDEGFF